MEEDLRYTRQDFRVWPVNSVLGKISGLRLGSQTEWKIQSLWTEPAQG